MAFDRKPTWYAAMVRDLHAVSSDLVYDRTAGGETNAAPVLRELRALQQHVERAGHRAEQARVAALLKRRHAWATRSRTLQAQEAPAFDPAAVLARLRTIATEARAGLRALERGRRYRDVPAAPSATTLYEMIDRPRHLVWRRALRGAQSLARTVRTMHSGQVSPHTGEVPALRDGSANVPLSVLYERWVYVTIVRAFQVAPGVDTVPDNSAEPFDLERAEHDGAQFRANGVTIRIRFEPWLVTREVAVARGESLYRAGDVLHAWRPDVVIQVEAGTQAGIPIVRAAYIVDAKLARLPTAEIWNRVTKYRYIRASINDEHVVQLIALAVPGTQATGANLEDEQRRLRVATAVLPLQPGDRSDAGAAALRGLVARVLQSSQPDR